ncbi:MAG: hypothetical protein RIS09_456 [Actinomycetota bacterium]|jgi:predicted short-subunit dehydrogenase-like oxidoreductase (DUF2520 family)
METAPRLTIGVIGAGRVGSTLAIALSNHHNVTHVHTTSENFKIRLSKEIPGLKFSDIETIINECQTVLFAVPDDELPGLIQGIASTIGFQPQQFVIHTSGRFGIDVLLPARSQGAIGFAIHPVMTLTGRSEDHNRLHECPYVITCEKEHEPIAATLVITLGGVEFFVKEEDRARYHAALAHASNHLNTIIQESKKELADIGIQQPELLLEPLVMASVENALLSGIDLLTGPISRGDSETIRAHIVSLSDSPMLETYKSLALATLSKVRGKLEETEIEAIERVLQ